MYEKYQVPAIFGPWAQVLIDAALPKQGEYVLDAACGTGIVARTVAGRVGKVIGIDLDPAMIAAAKEADPRSNGRSQTYRNCLLRTTHST